MDITKIQSVGYNITYIAMPGEHGPRVLWDVRYLSAAVQKAIKGSFTAAQVALIKQWSETAPAYLLAAVNQFAAEDPYMMYSLVSALGKYRWLVTDGSAYINTGYTSETDEAAFRIAYKQKAGTKSMSGMFGSQKVSQDTNWTTNPWFQNGGTTFAIYVGSSAAIQSYTNTVGQAYVFEVAIHSGHTVDLTMNGATVTKNWSGTISSGNKEIAFFTLWNGSDFTSRIMTNFAVREFYVENNNIAKRHYIPCVHNGENGMLDLLSATFYGNANTSGSFSIELEDA